MEHFESDLKNLSRALLSSNDINSLMNFLNNNDLLFIQVERVNIFLKSDPDVLYYCDDDKSVQRYKYTRSSMQVHGIVNDDCTHDIKGDALYFSYPQLEEHPAYRNISSYCKIPLFSASKPLGAIEFININLRDDEGAEKQLKLFTNMIASIVEHIIEHEHVSSVTQQMIQHDSNYQLLVDVTNAVISRSTKKELMTALLKFLYQYFGISDLSIIQPHEGHYGQHSCGYNEGKIDYRCHFFTNDSVIKDAVEKKKPVFLSAEDIRQLSLENNVPFFPVQVKSACIVPLIFRNHTNGYICYMQRENAPFKAADVELFMPIAARVAMAIHSLKVHQAIIRTAPKTDYITIEDSYTEHAIFDDIISQSEVMNQVLEKVAMVADCDSTVLILGESGTGKELIARAIHKLSRRSKTRMVKMNCAAVPAGLFESELFGHERGAFTGAISQRVGRFEQAHKGTLFLDEIGDMPLDLQPKLLRALQENEIERVGRNQLIPVDVRIVCATNVDLLSMVESKEFRSDLYYRLNVFPIRVPPLRERPEDIPLLVKHFTRTLSKKMGKDINKIPVKTMESLSGFPWPGNIRELRNIIERSVILTRGNVLNVPVDELRFARKQMSEDIKSNNPPVINLSTGETGRHAIISALKESNGIIGGARGAAVKLGLKRTTLLSRMQKMGIKSDDYLNDALVSNA